MAKEDSNNWNGEERRTNGPITRDEFNGLIRWIEKLQEQIQKHLQDEAKESERLEKMEADLDEINAKLGLLLDAWTQAQGAAKVAKFLFFVIGPLVAAAGWLSTHVTWTAK